MDPPRHGLDATHASGPDDGEPRTAARELGASAAQRVRLSPDTDRAAPIELSSAVLDPQLQAPPGARGSWALAAAVGAHVLLKLIHSYVDLTSMALAPARWLEVATEHPLRAACAVGLTAWAVLPQCGRRGPA